MPLPPLGEAGALHRWGREEGTLLLIEGRGRRRAPFKDGGGGRKGAREEEEEEAPKEDRDIE